MINKILTLEVIGHCNINTVTTSKSSQKRYFKLNKILSNFLCSGGLSFLQVV